MPPIELDQAEALAEAKRRWGESAYAEAPSETLTDTFQVGVQTGLGRASRLVLGSSAKGFAEAFRAAERRAARARAIDRRRGVRLPRTGT